MRPYLPAALLMFPVPLSAQQASAPAPAVASSAQEQAAIALAVRRGQLIHAYDQAAWHATDDLRRRLPDFAERVAGWIVDGPADAPTVVFYDRNAAAPRTVYRATLRGAIASDVVLAPPDAGEALSPARRDLAAARLAGLRAFTAAGVTRCTNQPSNTVVLPPEQPGGPTLVYLLAPQPDLDTLMLGGAYRVAVAADGSTSGLRPFPRSCLALPMKPKNGRVPVALVTSHLLDPVPTELHVFASLVAGKPLIVPIPNQPDKRVWIVDGTRIRRPSR